MLTQRESKCACRYADNSARGGVLEAEGMVEIKYRTPELLATMHRIDPAILKLKAEMPAGFESAVKTREAELLPVYRQVAVAFAAMHDTPARMVAKGVLRGIVPWSRARPFFTWRLRRRCALLYPNCAMIPLLGVLSDLQRVPSLKVTILRRIINNYN